MSFGFLVHPAPGGWTKAVQVNKLAARARFICGVDENEGERDRSKMYKTLETRNTRNIVEYQQLKAQHDPQHRRNRVQHLEKGAEVAGRFLLR